MLNNKPTASRVVEVFRQSSAGQFWSEMAEINEEVFIYLYEDLNEKIQKYRYRWMVTLRSRAKVHLARGSYSNNGTVWVDVGEFVTVQFSWSDLQRDMTIIIGFFNQIKKTTTPIPKPEPLPYPVREPPLRDIVMS